MATALALAIASSAPAPSAAPVPTFDDLMAYLHFDGGERARVVQGEIVGKDFRESDDKEISIAVVALFDAPLPRLVGEIRKGELLRADREVLDFRLFPPGTPPEEAFQTVGYSSEEAKEIRHLLGAAPGSTFNLSTGELERIRALRARFPGSDCERNAACAEAVSGVYRGLLVERLMSYQKDGLKGIAPYDRGSGVSVRPEEELRKAAQDAELIRRAFPEFYKAFTEFPSEPVEPGDTQFLWIKQRVQGRPAFALAHRLYEVRPDMALIAERQFYVGTSYNSLQTFIGLLPLGNRTLLVYTNRTFTDQVAGLASSMRHSLGRNKMMSVVTANLVALRQRLR